MSHFLNKATRKSLLSIGDQNVPTMAGYHLNLAQGNIHTLLNAFHQNPNLDPLLGGSVDAVGMRAEANGTWRNDASRRLTTIRCRGNLLDARELDNRN